MALNKADILALANRPPKMERVATEHGDFYLRVMTGLERDRFEQETWRGEGSTEDNLRAKFLVKTICDDKGQRLFNDEDHVSLGRALDAPTAIQLYAVAIKLNKMRLEDIKEMTKNSEPAQSGGTISDSQ